MEEDPTRAALMFGERVEVAPCLRLLDRGERVAVSGDRKIDGVLVGDLQEHPGIRATLVGLSGGVLRLERAWDTVRELRSDDWILMGALAISTLAAARLLAGPAENHLGATVHSFLSVLANVEFVLACG